ncbi:MAG: hydroxysqualene dehydroxylase HpnE [Planctomycetota bacterium]|nr:hydroxysqualene dehydroxylase HpnE [Planctomycetota bacterium]
MKRPVAILGGGLAGIAAALRLLEADCRPIVIETRKRLGGRATSFADPRTGLLLDNCQHVLLGCCTNLIDLYDRLGVLDLIRWHRTLHWTKGRGLIDRMKAGLLPAPLHLAGSFRRMSMFTAAEKRAIARAMRRLIRLGARGRLEWRDRTFADFLVEQEQPESIVRGFWNTIIVSACNLDVHRVSAATAMMVFQEGFLANRWSYTMGLSLVPLLELYDPAARMIEQGGGEIHLGTSARAIGYDGSRVTGVVTEDGLIEAAAVISAVPFDRLDALVSDVMRAADLRLTCLDRFEVSPILGVHLLFEQRVMELPHLVLVDRGVHWLFNKGLDEDGRQLVHAVVSAADAWMPLSEDEIVRRVVEDVHHALPGARGMAPIAARAIRERRATFAPTPESEQYRPGAEPGYVGMGGGGIPNLYLAGDWCDTGWPATMESAVRSGYAAAAALTDKGGVIDDVPPSWLARRLGLK